MQNKVTSKHKNVKNHPLSHQNTAVAKNKKDNTGITRPRIEDIIFPNIFEHSFP